MVGVLTAEADRSASRKTKVICRRQHDAPLSATDPDMVLSLCGSHEATERQAEVIDLKHIEHCIGAEIEDYMKERQSGI